MLTEEKKSAAAPGAAPDGNRDSATGGNTAAGPVHGRDAGVSAMRSAFPNAADYLVFLGIYFVARFAGMLAGWIGTGFPDMALLESADDAVRTAEELLAGRFNALSFFVTMSLTLGGLLLYRRRRGGPRIVARFSKRGLDPVLLVWGVALMVAASVVIEPLMQLLPPVPDAYGRGVWTLLTVAVMAPVFEELIFRGVLLESTRLRYGVVAAWLVPALMFGIVHLYPALVLNALVMGLVLGFVYIRSDSLWSAMILHAVNNALAYLLLLVGPQDGMLIQWIGGGALYAAVYLAALALFAVSGYMVWRTLQGLRSAEKNRRQA